MPIAKKRVLSGSSNGLPISVVQTGTLGNTIHTAISGSLAGTWDEIWLWASNTSGSSVNLTVEWGNATATNNIIVPIPGQVGLVPVIPGLILQNGNVVTAFAGTTAVINIIGFVNTITD